MSVISLHWGVEIFDGQARSTVILSCNHNDLLLMSHIRDFMQKVINVKRHELMPAAKVATKNKCIIGR